MTHRNDTTPTAIEAILAKRLKAKPSTRMKSVRDYKDEDRRRRQYARWEDLVSRIGRRYVNCRFDNFEADTDAKRAAVREVRAFTDRLTTDVESCQNLIIYGPVGTGKDHLLTAVMYAAIKADLTLYWRDGMNLFAELRGLIGSEVSEKEMLRRLAWPDVLAISDPLPPQGQMTDFQSSWMMRLIDRRYRDMRPTLITTNVIDSKDLYSRLGVPQADRLTESTLSVCCKWESYRKRSGHDKNSTGP